MALERYPRTCASGKDWHPRERDGSAGERIVSMFGVFATPLMRILRAAAMSR